MGLPKRNPDADFLPGTLEMLVLKTLSRGPNHGFGIAQHIQQVSGDALKIGEGSLYPALQRLLLNEFAEAEWGVTENNRRARYYRITAARRGEPAGAFGSEAWFLEESRAVWGFGWLDSLGQDIRYALRSFAKTPLF